jgi:peptidoglycan-associated lipoprotein
MLVLMGAKAEQIEAISWGEEKPRRDGHDESSWAENRRDDFVAK